MEIKDSWNKIKESVAKGKSAMSNSIAILNSEDRRKDYDLDCKIDKFIAWYLKNMLKDTHDLKSAEKLRKFIEKMAVWYELRYPDYEVNKILPGNVQEGINISDEMFKNNPYVNIVLDEDNDAKNMDWNEFYNVDVFVNSLTLDERRYLIEPSYRGLVYLEKMHTYPHFHLSDKGIVKTSEGIKYVCRLLDDKDLEGMHICDVVELLKENSITISNDSEVEEAINSYKNSSYFKDELLNCVMYKIIERGGHRVGPRRAFIFAKEFNRNIDIPMIYAIDRRDPGLRMFINEYIKAGGSKDLKCLNGYEYSPKSNRSFNIITIGELIRTQWNNTNEKWTKEETELHQQMVNVLAGAVDEEEVEKELVKQLKNEKGL